MAIMQQYRGNEDDWDVTKMKPGQFAVSLDRKYVRMCFAPGVAEKMALYDAFEEDMLQIQQILATCEDIQVAVEAFEVLAEQHANDAAASATASANSATAASDSALLSESWCHGNTGVRPGENTNSAEYWAGVAQAVADVHIATNDTVGIVKGNSDEIDIDVGGQMSINASFTPQETLTEVTGTEDKKTLFGKVAKAVSDLIAHKADTTIHHTLTNNLLATVAGTALDAVQGKALDTKVTANTADIATLNSKLTSIDVSSTFTYPATVTSFKAYKTGNMVHINCLIADSATTKANVIITPSTYKPKYSYTTMANNLDGWEATIQMVVNANISPATIMVENSNAKFTNTRLETYFEVQ